MAYATFQEITRRYPSLLTETAGGSYTAEEVVCSDYLYNAEMELNGRLASHFTVPFSGPPPTIADLCIDLAYYRSIRYTDPERAQKLRGLIDGRIEAIKDGKEYIFTGSGTSVAPESAQDQVWSSNEDYHPVHGMLDPEDSWIDGDRLDDEADERD